VLASSASKLPRNGDDGVDRSGAFCHPFVSVRGRAGRGDSFLAMDRRPVVMLLYAGMELP
jgi:hypothetical protein